MNKSLRRPYLTIITFLCIFISSVPVKAQLNYQWTWMDGPQSYNQSGSYGIQGTASASNAPGARINAVSWVGPDGDLWLFGGEGYDFDTNWSNGYPNFLNDLWRYDRSSEKWIWVDGPKTTNQYGVYPSQTGQAADSLMPGARENAVGWVGPDGDLWLFGGNGVADETFGGTLNDLWKYDISADQWTWVDGSNKLDQPGTYYNTGKIPGGRQNHIKWTGPNGNFWLFGGNGYDRNGDPGLLNDLWKYNPSTGTWSWVDGSEYGGYQETGSYGMQGVSAASNLPPSRRLATSWVGPDGNLWLFGGDIGSSGEYINDLWKYNISSGEWTWMDGSQTTDQSGTYGTKGVPSSSNIPGARGWSVSWRGPDGSLWLLGGRAFNDSDLTGVYNDLWRYDVSTGQWTWMAGDDERGPYSVYGNKGIASSTNEIGGRQAMAAWDTPSGNVWILGGLGYNTSFPDDYLSDLWRLTSDPAALQLNGTSDYAEIPDANQFDITSGFTLETWVKFDDLSSQGSMAIMMKGNSADAYGLLMEVGSSDKMLRFLHNGAGSGSTDLTWNNISTDTWYHVAATYDGSNTKIFIDGVEQKFNSASGAVNTNAKPLYLGQQSGSSNYRLNGTFAETRIWSKVLSTADLSDKMNISVSGLETDLAGAWLSRAGGRKSAVDLTGNANNLHKIDGSYVTDFPPVKVTITGFEGWKFLSAPGDTTTYSEMLNSLWTQGYSGSDGGTVPTSNVYFYDEANRSWNIPASASNIMGTDSDGGDPKGKGSLVYVYGDDDNDGNSEGFPKTITLDEFDKISPVQIPLDYYADNSGTPGWNLVSNPYPVSIYWDKIVNDGALKNARDYVYIWDQTMNSGNGDYRIHTGGTMPSKENFDGRIPPFQSFWVKATGNNANLNITASHQTPNTNALYKSGNTTVQTLELNMEGEGFEETISIIVPQEGDPTRADIPILQSLSSAHADLFLPGKDNQRFITQHLNVKDGEHSVSVPVDVDISVDGTYTLSWDLETIPKSWSLELEEVTTGQRFDLQKKESMLFSVSNNQSKTKEKRSGPPTPVAPGGAKAKDDNLPKFRLHISTTPQEQQQQVPTKAALEQNYPNPFNPATVISYDVPEQSEVSLQVYDMLGQKVATLVDEQKSPGSYRVDFNTSGLNLASGLYMYRLRVGSKVMTKKMTLIK